MPKIIKNAQQNTKKNWRLAMTKLIISCVPVELIERVPMLGLQ